MGNYKVFDGTNWVDPCTCDIRVRTSDDSWKLLEPRDCVTRYWDGQEWCLINCSEITDKTEINIWFDSSGSMDPTLPPLLEMRDNYLQQCLLPIYNNDINLYNTRVKIISEANERSVLQLGTERNFNYPNTFPFNTIQSPPWVNRPVDTTVNQVINLVYSDEANPEYWANPFDPNVQTIPYLNDVDFTRDVNQNPYEVKGTMFRVKGSVGQRDFVEALFLDNGLYTPPFNLSDFTSKFNANLDTEKGFTVAPSGITQKASDGVDWIPGVYTSPIITNSGLGSGMVINLEVVTIPDGLGTVSIINPGAGYVPNSTQIGFLTGGNFGQIIFTTGPAGEITSIIGVNMNGDGFTTGPTGIEDPGGVTVQAVINIDTLVSYGRLIYNASLGSTIVDYGNGLYVQGDSISVAPSSPAIGTTIKSIAIRADGGTPQYYLAELVTALNGLGLSITCS